MPVILNFGERTPEDLCLLCQRDEGVEIANSTATNSHFTPMGIIQSNTGRRNYEFTASINVASDVPIEIYYGRTNLENTDPVIREDPHTADYIFCQDCEDRLGVIEGVIIDVLNSNLRNPNHSQNFPITELGNGVFYKECNRVDTLKSKLFFYSIIWRQNLQQQLKHEGQGILDDEVQEKLRLAIVSGLYEGLEGNELLVNCFPFSIVTANSFEDSTLHLICPHPKRNYPEVFCINDYILLLYYKDDDENEEEEINRGFCTLPLNIFNEELDNNLTEPIRIAFISDELYNGFQKESWKVSKQIRYDTVAREEFTFILNSSFDLTVNKSTIKLDNELSREQKQLIANSIDRYTYWVNVQNRRLIRYKTIRIPDGHNLPIFAGVIELENEGNQRYQRICFYR